MNLKLGIISCLLGLGVATPFYLSSAGGGKGSLKPYSSGYTPEHFKQHCYTNFLQERNKGEVLVCEEKTSNTSTSNLIFYLYWVEDKSFVEVTQLEVKGTEVTFKNIGENPLSEKLTIRDTSNLDKLTGKTLQNICKLEKDHNQDPHLKCDNTTNNGAITSSAFSVLLKRGSFLFS